MNYNNAIEKTILFIESHLTASFTVEDAAREAVHQLIQSVTG